MADLKLKILMEAVDRVTAPFRGIRQSTQGLKGTLGETSKKVRELEAMAKQMERFRSIKMDARANGQALAAAQARAQALAQAMQGTENVTKAMGREFAEASAEVNRLKQAETRHGQELQQLRKRLAGAGVDTSRFGTEQKRLKAEIAGTTAAAAQQAAALERVAERARRLGSARSRMERTQATAGSMAASGAAGAATGGGALAGTGAIASVGVDFEAMMSKVGALARIEKTSEAFAQLEKQAFALGASTSFSASQAADAMSFLAMSGFDANKILAAMPGMLDLAKAGGNELAETADIASNILSGFGLQAEQMGEVGDILTATFTRSNVNLQMLGETMKYVAPIAKAAGYSLGDMAVLSGLLGNVGIQGSEAGTAMRAMVVRMAAPPKEAREALEGLGVATKDVAGNMRPIEQVLVDIAAKTKALGNADQLEIFSTVFGVEAAAAATELISQGGADGIKKFAQALRESAPGAAKRVAAEMADNAAGDIDGFTSAVEGMSIALTKINIAPIRSLTQGATELVNVATRWIQANPELAATLIRVTVAIAGVIFAGGSLALAIAGILGPFAMARYALAAFGLSMQPLAAGLLTVGRAAMGIVVPALKAMAAAALANPVVLIVAAIAAAAAALYIWWEPISGFFAGLWDRVSGIFAGAWERIKAVLGFTPLGLVLANWEPISSFFAGLWDRMSGIVAGAWSRIKVALSFTPLGLLLANWEPIGGFFAGLWDRVSGIVSSAMSWLQQTIAWSPLAPIAAAWAPVGDFFSGLWDGILAKVSGVWSAIEAKVASLRGMVDWVGNTWNGLFGDDTAPAVPAGPAIPTTPALPGTSLAALPASAPVPAAMPTPQPVTIVQVPPAQPTPPPAPPAPPAPVVSNSYKIEVHAAPGMSAEDVAREVRRQLDQRDAQARSGQRSAMYDH
jgi:TP901 family phage tail tape measure protein